MESLMGLFILGYLAWLLYRGGKKYGSRQGFAAGRYRSRYRKRPK